LTGLTEIIEVFSRLGVLGKLCSISELLTQRLALVHKAIEMAIFGSRVKTVLVSHKNAQKGALLVIYSPKCVKTSLLFNKIRLFCVYLLILRLGRLALQLCHFYGSMYYTKPAGNVQYISNYF
jgi:hypothetical protein